MDFKRRALALMTAEPPAMSQSETLIREWIKTNKKTLAGRTPDEVAHLAVLCGFNIADVCLTLSTFKDAIGGSYIEHRAENQSLLFDMTADRVHKMREAKELDLSPLWKDLVTQFENETVETF